MSAAASAAQKWTRFAAAPAPSAPTTGPSAAQVTSSNANAAMNVASHSSGVPTRLAHKIQRAGGRWRATTGIAQPHPCATYSVANVPSHTTAATPRPASMRPRAAPTSCRHVSALVRTALAGTAVRNHEMMCRRGDGTLFHADVTFAPVCDESGRTTSVSVFARDVTQRRLQEAEIRTLNAEL